LTFSIATDTVEGTIDLLRGRKSMAEEFIDTYAAAEELKMSRATLWRVMRERDIQRFKIPGDRRSLIRRTDLEALRQPVPMPRRNVGGQASKTAA
jgi:hypothetical protein